MKIYSTIPLLLLLAAGPATAADPDAGGKLVKKNCTECHGSEVYTRDDRRVKTRPGLSRQVQRCEQALGLTWFDDEVENAAEYLDRSYYHFGK
ncbi:MAG TPA: cytochrome c [Sedimenticola sp.]|nr:cytochrome c [Sedimenticola sp.]